MPKAAAEEQWPWGRGYREALQSRQQVEEIVRLLQLEGSAGMVDIGCGNGVFAIAAARRYRQCQVWACDPLESAVAECRRLAGELWERNLRAFVARAESIPLAGGCADRILIRNVLHHVDDPDAAFAEVGRLLRPGGRIVLEGPANSHDEPMGRFLTELHLLWDSSHQRRYYRPERIVAWLGGIGAEVESVSSWDYPMRLRPKLVEYVRQQKTDEKLRLRQDEEGNASVCMTMLRIIAAKNPGGPDEHSNGHATLMERNHG
jgi:SAM-dependent methyltransferase